MKQILWGMAFNAMTLPILCLNYILPTVGILLMFLGFRSLQSENDFFQACKTITLVQLLSVRFPVLIINGTIWQNAFNTSSLPMFFSLANLALTIALMLNFQNGFHSVREKAGLSERTASVNLLVIWYAILCAFELVPSSRLWCEIPMLILYGFIFRAFSKLSHELDHVGYLIKPASVRHPEWQSIALLTCLLLAGITAGYLLFHQYPMKWEKTTDTTSPEQEDLRTHLLALGIPENILNDMSSEDIAACEGALRVFVSQGDRELTPDSSASPTLRLTTIAIQLPDKWDGVLTAWKVIHHFEWLGGMTFYGTEAIEIWPAYYDNDFVWEPERNKGKVISSGRVLYTKDGETYASDYYQLGHTALEHFHPAAGMIDEGDRIQLSLTASFSFPSDADAQRGYVSYQMFQSIDIHSLFNSMMNYVHQTSALQYPVVPATAKLVFGSNWFRTIQTGILVDPESPDNKPIQ
ncbi:MAG: hypothetical protein IJZ85_10720 [Lachnospiraceae bacterium]|nr:hypothetical protein [Lachnospiraceae bacterium]